jgi:CRISPR-associated protein Cmr1
MVRKTGSNGEGDSTMRTPTDIQPPDEITPQVSALIEQRREYKLITPLFGGGVVAGEVDLLTPIRGSEIRGQLRFWWRATRGGQFNGDLAAMKRREDAIWGKAYEKEREKDAKNIDEGSEKKSDVRKQTVQVEVKQPGNIRPLLPFIVVRARKDGQLAKNKDGSQKYQSKPNEAANIPPYIAFPLQPSQEKLDQFSKERDLERLSTGDLEKALFPRLNKVYKCDDNFTLIISFSVQYRADIEAALWAWETFGGIGARTRRGFGSLRCISVEENQQVLELDLPDAEYQQAEAWIRAKLQKYDVDGLWAKDVPHLQKQDMVFNVVGKTNTDDQLMIWRKLIDTLRNFRQKRLSSTKNNARHPGRSMWPEPSEIRRNTRQSLSAHKREIPDPPIAKFPRAAFGLPIIFQFKDRNKYNLNDSLSDPRKTVLQLVNAERFASPLILKPLSCRDEAYLGLALILEGTKVEDEQLLLKTQEGKKEEWNAESAFQIGESLVIDQDNSFLPIRVDHQTNALQAFLKYLIKEHSR